MTSDRSVPERIEAPQSPLSIVVVGGGPKAAALATKAKVLRDLGSERRRELGIPEVDVEVVVLEATNYLAANWRGSLFGFTDGETELCTPPENDMGFPYKSVYGDDVDVGMLKYTWQAYQMRETSYPGWVDLGRRRPALKVWARYVEWALEEAEPKISRETVVERIDLSGGKLLVQARKKNTPVTYKADGVVFTGPGEPIKIGNVAGDPRDGIFDGKNYWIYIDRFRDMTGKVAVIGGGGTAASIALSLLQIAPAAEVDIINPRGSIFLRGESVKEKRWFWNADEWPDIEEDRRLEFLKRNDRGVFSAAAQTQFDESEKLDIITGKARQVDSGKDEVVVTFERGDPPKLFKYSYKRAIIALGFDPFSALEMIPAQLRPKCGTAPERLEVQRKVDKHLRLPFDSVPSLAGQEYNIHVPMLAALAQGPGFPNLRCLGLLSDRILARYITPPGLARRGG